MRIGIDARFYGTEHTGLGRYTKNVLDNLFSEDDPTEYVVFVSPKYQHLKFPGQVKVVVAHVAHYSLKEQLVIPFLLLQHRCHKLYTLHFNAPILSFIPEVVTVHDLIKTHFQDISTSTHNHFIFWLKRLGYKLVMGHAITHAHKIIVPTRAVKSNILTAYPLVKADKIIPIHEAVDPIFHQKSANTPKRDKLSLLFVGNAYPHKNLVRLLAVFTLLRREGDYRLTLLSKSTPFLTRSLQSLNPVDRPYVRIDQDIKDAKLKKHFQTAGVLVMPSLMEGFGLPALEAMTQGAPVAVSDIPVFKEVYGKRALYFNPFDIQSMKKTITKALSQPTQTPYFYPRTWKDVSLAIKKELL